MKPIALNTILDEFKYSINGKGMAIALNSWYR